MDTREVIAELTAIERRVAGSNAERRAARALAQRLRRAGRRSTRLQTVWVRPHWPVVHALICAVAVAGSVLSVDHDVAGLALSAGALAALVLDLAGVQVLRRLTFERATQNVVSLDPERRPVRLVLTAATDAPPAQRRWPVHGALVLALVALAACCAVRVAIDDPPSALGIVQLIPTVVLIVVIGLLLDRAAAPTVPDDGSAPAAVLAMLEALQRRPPRMLAVDVVFAGAGHAHAMGMRRWVAQQAREGVRGEQICVLHLAPCEYDTAVWWTHQGLVLPRRFSAQLRALAETVARAEPSLGARPIADADSSGALAARARRWPAIAISAPDSDAAAAFGLALVAALDRDLLDRGVVNASTGGG